MQQQYLMAENQEIVGYQVIDTLGHGARSTIYAVQDKDNQVYALKRVVKRQPEDQRFLDQALNEHQIASQLDHRTLRRSLQIIRHRKLMRTREIIVLMEMVDGLTLEQVPDKDAVEVCALMQQIAIGIEAMHEAGFVHADMKPNNVLVTGQQTVKLIDFGQSCKIGTVKPRIQGTPDYIAAEQVRREPIVTQTDIFNLGATMYWLLTQKHVPTLIPKSQGTINLQNTTACPPPSELNPDVPPALSSLVMNCIQSDPSDRPQSMREVHDRLGLAMAQIRRAPPFVVPDPKSFTPGTRPAIRWRR